MLLGHPDATSLVVSAFVHYSTGDGYGSDRVESALVAPRHANSLVRAVESGFRDEDQFYFEVPREDAWRDGEIDSGQFQLRGWLREEREPETNLEKHDPLARLDSSPDLPGTAFQEHHSARRTSSDQIVRGSDVLSWVRRFSDEHRTERERDRHRDLVIEGYQTFIDTSILLKYLQATDMSLIIKIHSTRRDRDQRNYDEPDRQERHSIVLIDGKGVVKGLAGRRSLW
jgi:hypothetical protein